MRFVLLSFVFLVACGDAPVKKGGSNVVNNTSTNNTNNTNGGTNNVTNGTNNVNTNNTCGCAANEECVFETDEPTCQCRPGYEQTDRGCVLQNEPPVVSNVSISPAQPPYPGQPLSCEYTFSDPDDNADNSQIEWLIGDQVISTTPTFTAYLEKEQITCRVTANDGRVNGNTETSPVLTAPLHTLISAATSHTCIRTREGAVKCWGDNSYFRLGTTQPGRILTPVTPPGLESNVDGIYAGERHTCVLQDDAVKCWGDGGDGVAGLSQTDFATPQVMLEGNIKAVVSGNNHVCAIQGSALKCWGVNYFGQLGIPAQYRSFDGVGVPTVVTGMGAGVSAVSAGEDHTCAIQNGFLYCWGSNSFGSIGATTMSGWTNQPTAVLDAPVTETYAGGNHSCANHNGALKCWGANYDGEVGAPGLPTTVTTPTIVTVVDGPFDTVMLGGSNTCVQKGDVVQCWGSSEDGQLQTAGNSVPPQTLISSGATAFGVGSTHMCGERLGILSCWGGNLSGQTADPSTAGTFAPGRTPYVITY